MKINKALLSLFFCICVIFAQFPVTALALDDVSVKGEKVSYNGHTYQLFYTASLNWHEMQEYCEDLGGYLACITDSAEDKFLYDYINKCGEKNAYFGFTDYKSEGSWEWVSGEKTDYTNWALGEGSNQGGYEHYGMYYQKYTTGKWNDGDGVGECSYICEWGSTDSEEPFDASFSAQHGWPLLNTAMTFGYENNYKIPIERYYDLYGYSISSLVTGGISSLTKWNGSCFGLSLLAAANYEGIIDLSDLFEHDGDTLREYGYDDIKKHNGRDQWFIKNGQQYFSVADSPEIVRILEGAQISQKSKELKKANVFKNDNRYQQLLAYLNGDNVSPLVVCMLAAGHAVVIDPSVRPIALPESPGCYAIALYDSNNPGADSRLINPAEFYRWSPSYLQINTNDGRYNYLRNGETVASGDFYTLTQGVQNIHNITFYDISKLDSDYFYSPLKLWGNLITIEFGASDLLIIDDDGNTLFEVEDNTVIALDEECEYLPYLEGDNDILRGSISLPDTAFRVTGKTPSAVMALSEKAVAAFNVSKDITASVDLANNKLTLHSDAESSVFGVLQNGTDDSFSAFQINAQLDHSDITLNGKAEQNTLVTSSDPNSKIDILMENSDSEEITEYKDVPVNKIKHLDITNNKLYLTEDDTADDDIPTVDDDDEEEYHSEEETEEEKAEDNIFAILLEKIAEADSGDVIKADITGKIMVPVEIIKALSEQEDVTLILQRDSKSDIVLTSDIAYSLPSRSHLWIKELTALSASRTAEMNPPVSDAESNPNTGAC